MHSLIFYILAYEVYATRTLTFSIFCFYHLIEIVVGQQFSLRRCPVQMLACEIFYSYSSYNLRIRKISPSNVPNLNHPTQAEVLTPHSAGHNLHLSNLPLLVPIYYFLGQRGRKHDHGSKLKVKNKNSFILTNFLHQFLNILPLWPQLSSLHLAGGCSIQS